MKFTFDRDSLIKEIAITQEIIAHKSPISILSSILLVAENNTLTIKASDQMVNFITKIPVDVIEEGSTTVLCDKFMSILSSSPSGEIEFEQQDIKVTIRTFSKKYKAQLKSIASEKFPDFTAANDVPFFDVPAKDFKEMIQQTIFSVSDNKQKYFLTGVHFCKKGDNFVMVSTDSKRLSYCEKLLAPGIDFPPAIVPTKILRCVLKNASDEGNISLGIVDNMLFVRFGNYEFSSKLIDGQFPNYQKVIPENLQYNFQVNKDDFESALKRIEIMVEKNADKIIFRVGPGVLNISTPESDIGEADEEIPCRYDGEEIALGLSYRHIAEPLKSINSEYIAFEFTELTKAIKMRPEPAGDYFHIMMPINLTN